MCRRLITEFLGFCLHFYLDWKCAFEADRAVATIFCPVVLITGQLRGEQKGIKTLSRMYPGHSSLNFCPWDLGGAGLKHSLCDSYNWMVDPQDCPLSSIDLFSSCL